MSVFRWVQRFTPLVIDAARPCRHAPGDRWFVDETYVKIAGRWVYLYRAIDQFGQVIDVLVSEKRDLEATHRFFTRALTTTTLTPIEVITDKAAVYPRVLDELAPGTWHHTEQYANNRIEADHGRLKSRLRPMRGLKQLRCARVISTGHAFVQNIRRGHYELGIEEPANAAGGGCLHRADRGHLIRPREQIQPATASHNALGPGWCEVVDGTRRRPIVRSNQPGSGLRGAETIGMEASAVSHQLRLLRTLGLVTGTRAGQRIVYALHDNHVAMLLDEAVYHSEHLRLGVPDPGTATNA